MIHAQALQAARTPVRRWDSGGRAEGFGEGDRGESLDGLLAVCLFILLRIREDLSG